MTQEEKLQKLQERTNKIYGGVLVGTDLYIARKVVRETDKAYQVEVIVNNRRDGNRINYKWVSKSVCKGYEYSETELQCIELFGIDSIGKIVLVPEWIIGNGVW